MKLEIKNVTKTYSQKMALDNISLTMTEGIYALLGPNGAGKSTLMNIIAGNTIPTTGEVVFDGKNIKETSCTLYDNLGFMPQQQGIYQSFTGRRFLYYIAALKGMKKQQARSEIEQALEFVNLKDFADKKIGAYSGGMKQRILIAQAILNNPKVLIFDEPTAGLDPKERIRIRNMISQIAKDKIVLIATHVVSDIEQIASAVIMLQSGKIIREASPKQLISELEGKVFDIIANAEDIPLLEQNYIVSNIFTAKQGCTVRVVSDENISSKYISANVNPTLEEVYLWAMNK